MGKRYFVYRKELVEVLEKIVKGAKVDPALFQTLEEVPIPGMILHEVNEVLKRIRKLRDWRNIHAS